MIKLLKIDTTGLNAIVAEALKYSKRAPGKVVNSTLFHVARRARQYTPHVPPARIAGELAHNVLLPTRHGQRRKSAPMSVAIIQSASRRKGTPSPFAGVKRSRGRTLMRAAVRKLLGRRRKSSRFLAAGWVAVLKEARRHLYGGGAIDVNTISVRTDDAFGNFTPAREGTNVSGAIANRIGMTGPDAQKFNAAMHRHSGPALQRAIDEQALSMARHYARRILNDSLKQKAAASGGILT